MCSFKNYLRLFGAFLLLLVGVCEGHAANGDRFRRVGNVSEITDGDVVIVVRLKGIEKQDWVLSKNDTGSSIHGTSVSIDGDVATVDDNAELFRLDNVKDNQYRLFALSNSKYLCNNSTERTCRYGYLGDKDKNFQKRSLAEISFSADGKVSIVYSKDTDIPQVALMFTSSDGYFNCKNPDDRFNAYRCVYLFKQISDPVIISDEADNTSVIEQNNCKAVAVSLSRKLIANKWNTFCIPFDVDVSDGKIAGVAATVMEYSETMGNVLMFTQAKKIEAGKAYLIKPTEDIVNPQFAKVTLRNSTPTVSGTDNGYTFRGVYSPKTFTEEESKKALIVKGDDKKPFWRPEANGRIKGMRAYFTTPDVVASENVQLMLGGTLTDISDVVSDTSRIADDSNVYTVDGVKLGRKATPERGIYIKNGKKFVVK